MKTTVVFPLTLTINFEVVIINIFQKTMVIGLGVVENLCLICLAKLFFYWTNT